MANIHWQEKTTDQVVELLKTDIKKGLSMHEAAQRLRLHGPNQLLTAPKRPLPLVFLDQFKDFMVLVLLAAAVVSGFVGDMADTVTILAIVLINGTLGFVQSYRAEESLEKLKEMAAPEANVIRGGVFQRIPGKDLTQGDIVLLEAGMIIPADLRLLEAHRLAVDEAALTGESLPVNKKAEITLPAEIALGDRLNMAYMGTVVTMGKGLGVVVATGMLTEIGVIAASIRDTGQQKTPLERRLDQLGRWLVLFCGIIVTAVALLGWLRGAPFQEMFLTGISLAVAAIPEGLPAIVTVSLAIGVQRMARRNAIVRHLPAVESLGCATVICSDKTGTLTQSTMVVTEYFLSGKKLTFKGRGYEPKGEISYPQDKAWLAQNQEGLQQAWASAVLCSNARLSRDDVAISGLFRGRGAARWNISGDPTEGALLVAAAKAGVWREKLPMKRLDELPFDSERKRMSVLVEDQKHGRQYIYCKGAPDILLSCCDRIWWEGQVRPLTKALTEQVIKANEEMAGRALRVLGLAYRDNDKSEIKEEKLIFLSLAGMMDPPREGVKEAVAQCRIAGIKTMMLTGDHVKTAEAVALELGIMQPQQKALTGNDLDELSDRQLRAVLADSNVFARVSPRHKLRLVNMLQDMGAVAAMTGDGVNDGPAVKAADIGIAMGQVGTDVTREAADLILADDNFTTIVAAVEEGRIIYNNIRRFIRYLLACNTGEVLVMFIATLLGVPLPLIPIQILWVNLVTDGLPAMALGMDPGDDRTMRTPPRDPRESVFADGLGGRIILDGILIALATLSSYVAGFLVFRDIETARTMAFCSLVLAQLVYVFRCAANRGLIKKVCRNPWLPAAVLTSLIMQLAVVYIPFLRPFFDTIALHIDAWLLVIVPIALATFAQQLLQWTFELLRSR